jgi:hypothetical protein
MTPTPPLSYPNKKCSGRRYKTLMKMDIKELLKYMRATGLKKGLPDTRKGLVDYLCAAEENGRCDPVNGKWCNGKFICDASNTPGVCVSPSQSSNHTSTITYNGKKLIGTSDAIEALKLSLDLSEKGKKSNTVLPEPWSVEGLIRKKLINNISLLTRKEKNYYNDFSTDELREELEGMEIDQPLVMTQKNDSDKTAESKARNYMITRITRITGEDTSKYDRKNLDEIMDILEKLNDDQQAIEDDKYTHTYTPPSDLKRKKILYDTTINNKKSLMKDSDEDKLIMPVKKTKKLPTPESSSSESDDSDEDKLIMPVKKTKKLPTPESSSSESEDEPIIPTDSDEDSDEDSDYEKPEEYSDEDSDEDSDYEKPEEDTAIVSIEDTLADVVTGQKKIGEFTKVQKSILKCMGLLS